MSIGIEENQSEVFLNTLVQITSAMFNLAKKEGNADLIAGEIMKSNNEASAITFIELCRKNNWSKPLEIAAARKDLDKDVFAHIHEAMFVMGNKERDNMTSSMRKNRPSDITANIVPKKLTNK